MSGWERQLEEYNSLLEQVIQKSTKGEGELRFDNSCVRASDVASQYFCEKKVEMQYLYGEIETETKNQGTEAHEKLLEGSEEVSRQNLWKKIHGKKPVFALELLLLAKYKDLVLAGRPDRVLFENGFPLIIFEYKFSRSKRDYLSYHVQARTYGIIKEAVLTTENAVIYLNKFNPNEAEQSLDWAIEFWNKQREAIPTRNPNKCKSCEYNVECDACALTL
jgi:hypothetical protein